MKFEGTKVTGWENAIIGMRLPMSFNYEDAKSKIDSKFYSDGSFLEIGSSDLKVMKNLISADVKGGIGQPNSKFLRMIHVQVAVTAPMYWYSEADTYKVGVTRNSSSKMHKLASTPITKDCFENDDFENVKAFENHMTTSDYWGKSLIPYLESLRVKYNGTKDKKYWKELIRMLPESWLQTSILDLDYATLKNIYRWRHNHRLAEWHTFCDWIKTLPLSSELIIGE